MLKEGWGRGKRRSEGYTELEIELSMDCEHHLDENCPPWDHELNLYLCLKGVACHDRSTTVGRWVTAYGREVHWLSAAPAAIPLLTSKEAMEGKGGSDRRSWPPYGCIYGPYRPYGPLFGALDLDSKASSTYIRGSTTPRCRSPSGSAEAHRRCL